MVFVAAAWESAGQIGLGFAESFSVMEGILRYRGKDKPQGTWVGSCRDKGSV